MLLTAASKAQAALAFFLAKAEKGAAINSAEAFTNLGATTFEQPGRAPMARVARVALHFDKWSRQRSIEGDYEEIISL